MRKDLHKVYIGLFFLVGGISLFMLIYSGFDYYSTPLKDRFYHADHQQLKPSGFIGHGIGILGSLMMITGVAIYMIRKRVKKFMRLGVLKHWLELHIFLCTVGPILILFHTAFKFGGIVSVSFWSMVAVVLSGVIGRFIYVQIPRTIQGQELNLDDIREMDIQMNNKLRNDFGIEEKLIAEINGYAFVLQSGSSIFGSIKLIIKSFFLEKLFKSKIRRALKIHSVDKTTLKQTINIVASKLALQRKIKILSNMQKLFKYWHVAHLPFAIIMFVIMILHIGVAITFGYRWIF